MDWFWIVLIGLIIFGWIAKGAEKEKEKKEAKAEIAQKKERAEAARAAILASGNREAIERLHLMEASYQAGPGSAQQAVAARAGPGMLGTAAAVAGGMVVGNAVAGAVQAAQLEAAFTDLEAGLQASEEASLVGLDATLSEATGDDDFDFEI